MTALEERTTRSWRERCQPRSVSGTAACSGRHGAGGARCAPLGCSLAMSPSRRNSSSCSSSGADSGESCSAAPRLLRCTCTPGPAVRQGASDGGQKGGASHSQPYRLTQLGTPHACSSASAPSARGGPPRGLDELQGGGSQGACSARSMRPRRTCFAGRRAKTSGRLPLWPCTSRLQLLASKCARCCASHWARPAGRMSHVARLLTHCAAA